MNVSSVKNLNGETFSAVQDAALTDVVQTNSGVWNDVSAYQTNSATYMTEPNLEYNAVNEISGYNGSAIAQYGAEKQWLVHDDTLVHAANSAQYALGCNISALQRLMSIDETVLWEGSAAITTGYQSIATNEPATAFNTIKIYGESWVGWNPVLWGEVSGTTNQFSLAPSYLGANGAAIRICQIMFNNSNSGYNVGNGRLFSLQGTAVSVQEPQNTWLRKIVGISRKA